MGFDSARTITKKLPTRHREILQKHVAPDAMQNEVYVFLENGTNQGGNAGLWICSLQEEARNTEHFERPDLVAMASSRLHVRGGEYHNSRCRYHE